LICKECCLLCVTARPTPWFPASLIVTRYLLHASPHCPPPIAQLRSCIQRLLQDDVNPKLEDLECLCKLLSTIGQQLERGGVVKGSAGMTQAQLAQRQKDKAMEGKKLMDAYFARIQRLVDNKALDSRLRFMLMDIQEQRSRGWAVRRKAEGPMKIEVPLLGGGEGGEECDNRPPVDAAVAQGDHAVTRVAWRAAPATLAVCVHSLHSIANILEMQPHLNHAPTSGCAPCGKARGRQCRGPQRPRPRRAAARPRSTLRW
jgi:hypothetical protein